MADADEVVVKLKLEGGRLFASSAEAAGASLLTIESGAKRAETASWNLGKAFGRANSALDPLRRSLKLATTGVIGLTAAGGLIGLRFNSQIEQATVSFGQFLGSTRSAKKLVGDLWKLAATTPFEFPQLLQATRQMLAYGFAAKDVVPDMKVLSDVVSGLSDPAAFDQVIRALGQIRNKGKLQSEELGQLAETGALSIADLAKRLGMSTDQLYNKMSKRQIDASKALPAIFASMAKRSRGLAQKQSRTFAGQLSTLRDNIESTLGTITKPLFDRLRKDILPRASALTGAIQMIFQNTDLSFGDKVKAVFDAAKFWFKPVITEWLNQLRQMDLGTKINDALDAALPVVLNKMGSLAKSAAGAFFDAWKNADIWGKLFGTWLVLSTAKKFGVFDVLGSKAAKKLAGKLISRAIELLAGEEGFAALAKNSKLVGAVRDAGTKLGTGFGRWFLIGAIAGLVLLPEIIQGIKDTKGNVKKGTAAIKKRLQQEINKAFGGVKLRATGGVVQPGETTIVGEAGPELAQFPAGTRIFPLPQLSAAGMVGPVTTHAVFNIDGRTIMTAVARATDDSRARRGYQ
jgi:tape measure domain-containing protein